jgi:hypothetical protein
MHIHSWIIYIYIYYLSKGRDSSVTIVTHYGLDGPRIEFRWEWDFPHPSRPSLWPTQPPIQWVPGLSRGVKRPGRGVDHPPRLAPRLKKRIELYLYSTSWPSWTLPLPSPLSSVFIQGLLHVSVHTATSSGPPHKKHILPQHHAIQKAVSVLYQHVLTYFTKGVSIFYKGGFNILQKGFQYFTKRGFNILQKGFQYFTNGVSIFYKRGFNILQKGFQYFTKGVSIFYKRGFNILQMGFQYFTKGVSIFWITFKT